MSDTNVYVTVRERLMEARSNYEPFDRAWLAAMQGLRHDDLVAAWDVAGEWRRAFNRMPPGGKVAANVARLRAYVDVVDDDAA